MEWTAEELDAYQLGKEYQEAYFEFFGGNNYDIFREKDPRKHRYWNFLKKTAKKLRRIGIDFRLYLWTVMRGFKADDCRPYLTNIDSERSWGYYRRYQYELTDQQKEEVSGQELIAYYEKIIDRMEKKWKWQRSDILDYLNSLGRLTQNTKELLEVRR